MKSISSSALTHHLLIAMPHLDDPNFAQTLVYVVEHSTTGGTMGLVVNRPNGITLADILEQLNPDQEPPALCHALPIYAGGPVQTERGFVLHPSSSEYSATMPLGTLSLTSSQDILQAIAEGRGPKDYLIALGYAGWDPGQLERELVENAWLTCSLEDETLADILFHQPDERRLEAAAQTLGIDLSLLSCQAGHA